MRFVTLCSVRKPMTRISDPQRRTHQRIHFVYPPDQIGPVVGCAGNLGAQATRSKASSPWPSYSGNEIDVTRGGTNPELNDQVNAAIPAVFPDSVKLYGADRAHPALYGGAGYDTLWNAAPWSNGEDLFVLRDDHSAALGDHFFKAGVLASWNRKNEDTGSDFGSPESPAFLWATGLKERAYTNALTYAYLWMMLR
jgi:hypothetical protein